MGKQEGEIVFAKRLGFFIPVLFASAALTLALIRLEFETGSPLADVLPIILSVFAINYWSPSRLSLITMIVGAVVACGLFLGPYNTGALIAILATYTSLFYVFRQTKWRIAFALLITGGLMFLRLGLMHLPFVPLAVPVAGSMIMFRFILMIYEHHYKHVESTWLQKFAYLFLLPSLAFPLYPIVDYKNYISNHRPKDHRLIRTGLTRICAGLVFMMIYRILYLYVLPSYVEVHDALSAGAYMTGSYLYVINILGIFWAGIGYLTILGYDMPPVFNNMFLIDSFRDIWRRINTYWRDFAVKLIYYPLYFKLRKKTKAAILITSLVTLTISALLHGWQWFWLQGTILIQSTGIIFWTIIGLVISINLALQPKGESGIPVAVKSKSLLVRAIRITGMFVFMSFMWSLWNSTGISDWLFFLHFYMEGNALQWMLILSGLLIFTAIIFVILKFFQRPPGYHILSQPVNSGLALAAGIVLMLPTIKQVSNTIPGPTGKFIASVATLNLTDADQASATENYYNRMLASDGTGLRPWEMHTPGAPAKSGLDEACSRREDLLVRELIPNKVTILDGWTITTNQWGMRDKNYTKEKPAGTFRIAILGASYEMGSGVPQDSVFEALAEKMLIDSGMKIEILNFSVGGYHLPQQVWIAQHKIPEFQPDLVLCFVHPSDATRNSNYMGKLIKNGTDLLYPELYAIKKSSGAEQNMGESELKNRLYPYSDEIATWSLEAIAVTCDSMNSDFGVVYIPVLKQTNDAEFYRDIFQQGNTKNPRLSTVAFYDLSEIFRGKEDEYKLVSDPTHPNGKGHLVIATAMIEQLTPYVKRKTLQK